MTQDWGEQRHLSAVTGDNDTELIEGKGLISIVHWHKADRSKTNLPSCYNHSLTLANCQPASDWSRQITWPEPWPLIGGQLTSDCCIIPGVCGPASRQFSQTKRGNFSVNTQWCTAANTGLSVYINIKPGLGITQNNTWCSETSLDIYQAPLKLQLDMDKALLVGRIYCLLRSFINNKFLVFCWHTLEFVLDTFLWPLHIETNT